MNALTLWLDTFFDEIEPKKFYREIFPVGSFQKRGEMVAGTYNGIAVCVTKQMRKNGKPLIKRYTVTDDLDVIDELGKSDDFCLMSPISYAGKNRTAENARYLYAFTVDLDKIRVKDNEPIGLINLWTRHIEAADRIPKPTFIVSSGTGLHLYYVLEEPVAMYPNVAKELQNIKRDLTSLIWHDTIVDIKEKKEVQQEGIYQGFRVPGTITRGSDRARAFVTGDRISLKDLMKYTDGFRKSRERLDPEKYVKKKTIPLEKAKELYPDWYRRRIENNEPSGTWHVSRNLYDWWKEEIRLGAVVGHRYFCMMMLAIYAQKCSMYDPKHNPNPVTEKELERDSFELMKYMESLTVSEDNHFTEGDVLDALEAFNQKWITYPKNSIEYKSGIQIKKNKRNGRKQKEHLKLMNYIRDEINQNTDWRNKEGRPKKDKVVMDWKLHHPDGIKADCIKDTGLDRKTVSKYWDCVTLV